MSASVAKPLSTDYDDLDLGFAAKDARDVAAAFRSQQGRLFRKVDVKLLENATNDQVMDGLEWLEKQTTANDIVVIFLLATG